MTMGVITKHLIGLVAKQVEDHGLVVWYDPERGYAAVVEQIGAYLADNRQRAEDEGQATTDHGQLPTPAPAQQSIVYLDSLSIN